MRDGRTLRQLKMRTTPLSVSFSQIERDDVQNAASAQGETVSAFIRAAAIKAAARVNAREAAKRSAA